LKPQGTFSLIKSFASQDDGDIVPLLVFEVTGNANFTKDFSAGGKDWKVFATENNNGMFVCSDGGFVLNTLKKYSPPKFTNVLNLSNFVNGTVNIACYFATFANMASLTPYAVAPVTKSYANGGVEVYVSFYIEYV
jgi:hypothetical protein